MTIQTTVHEAVTLAFRLVRAVTGRTVALVPPPAEPGSPTAPDGHDNPLASSISSVGADSAADGPCLSMQSTPRYADCFQVRASLSYLMRVPCPQSSVPWAVVCASQQGPHGHVRLMRQSKTCIRMTLCSKYGPDVVVVCVTIATRFSCLTCCLVVRTRPGKEMVCVRTLWRQPVWVTAKNQQPLRSTIVPGTLRKAGPGLV